MFTFYGRNDFVRIRSLSEGLGVIRCARRGSARWRIQIDTRIEAAALEAALRYLGEQMVDGVKSRTRGRREMESEALMQLEPGTDFE
ncbi:MAG: hypothetical protein E5V60_00390 [Mesorhizobium sp.]|nr:MAG: hypothetical protein EOR08_30105 [Mesorhizobium sp.]TIW69482.1 MAG: hypothetical protein E5V60_00390 [Mesorhizobium sp.]